MSELVVFNGASFIIPVPDDVDWGQNVTDFLVAIPAGCLQNTGGAFTLTADANFGATFGLVSAYFKSRTSNIASAGVVRLANADLVEWRNFANSGNNTLGVNSSNQLVYNGSVLEFNALTDSHIFVGNASNVAADVAMTGDIAITNAGVTSIGAGKIVNAQINVSAAIAYTKLNLTGSIVNADIYSSAAIAFSKLASLTSAHILVGSAGNVATDTAMSGDATLANTGALTLATVNSNVGSFTSASVTVNAKGLITAASSGTTGNLTDAGTDGIVITGGTGAVIGSGTSIAQHVADATHSGYLSSTDWNTFNNKETATLTNTHIFVGNASNVATDVALSGDATLANTGALTLATVNATTGSFGSSTAIPTFTVNGKGLITAASTAVVIAPAGTLTGTTLASNVVSSSLTSLGTITSGVWTGTTIAVANGGTGQTTYTDGQLLIGNTSGNTLTKAALTGTANQIVVTNGNGSITLSTPQSIGTGSSPTFAGLTLSSPLTVANGGTGDASLTAYAVLCGGTTSTAAIQSVAALGASGTVLTSNGAGALPTFQAVSGSGTVNSGTATQMAYYATSSTAVSSSAAVTVGSSGANGIVTGTNTNDSAASGKVGEYVESVISTGTSFPATTAYGDLTSISLTAGDWEVTLVFAFNQSGATWTSCDGGISTTSGNSSTGLVYGSNLARITGQNSATMLNAGTVSVAGYRMSLSATTTVYAKMAATYSLGTPDCRGRLSARRMR